MSIVGISSPLLNSGATEILLIILQTAHVVVLGYWLGAELVINSSYRYASSAVELPFAERDRMLTYVMNIDQHVRYALVLQLTTGLCLAAILGYLPINVAWVMVFGLIWIVLVNLCHRLAASRMGQFLVIIDRDLRLIVIGCLVIVSSLGIFGEAYLPFWLALKLCFFAGIIACGVGIRLVLLKLFKVWNRMRDQGPTTSDDAVVRKIYHQATAILILLWLLIATIVILSLLKPVY